MLTKAEGECQFWRRRGACLARSRYGPARVLGHLERAVAALCLHAVRACARGYHRNQLPSLPEPKGFECGRGGGESVLPRVIELLRGGRATKLRHRCRVPGLPLLADVVGYRDGREYSDDDDDYQQFDQGETTLANFSKLFCPTRKQGK